MVNTIPDDTHPLIQIPNSNIDDPTTSSSIQICNQYHTWEPYYAKIVPLLDDTKENETVLSHISPFQIVGAAHGTLAPQGGSNNMADCAKVSIQCVDSSIQINDSIQWYLVVGTEEEKWYYSLQLS